MCPVSPENFHPNTNSVTSLHKLMSPPLGTAQSEATSTSRLPAHLHRTSGGFWGHIKIQCKELKSYIWYAWSAIMAHYTLNFKWHLHLIYVTQLCFQLEKVQEHRRSWWPPWAYRESVWLSCLESHTVCARHGTPNIHLSQLCQCLTQIPLSDVWATHKVRLGWLSSPSVTEHLYWFWYPRKTQFPQLWI